MDTIGKNFGCNECGKGFKLKHHLHNHVKVCKKIDITFEIRSFICNYCPMKFKLKHHLEAHKITHKQFKCKSCRETFLLSEKLNHIKEFHKKFFCDLCDYVGDIKHKKRHMMAKHKGWTPAITARAEENKKNKYMCKECQKCFYCKSNLNRHVAKVHKKYNEDNKNNIYQNVVGNFAKVHNKYNEDNLNSCVSKIQFKDIIEQIIEIPYTKTKISDKGEELTEMFRSIEKVMMIVTNREQRITANTLISCIERQTNKEFNVHHFRTLASLNLFHVNLVNNELEVSVSEKKLTPELSNLRFDSLQKQINDAKKDRFSYIDLINFPETNKREYKTAIQVIEENIFKITEIKTINECTENEGQKKSIIQSLVYKIREKERNNKRRSEQFNKIDWQIKSMPELARLVNSIYMSNHKSTLHKKYLIDKIECMNYKTVRKIEDDLTRLIEISNGWLREYNKGWIRRNQTIDINNFCELIK